MPSAVPRLRFTCLICRVVFKRTASEATREGHSPKYCSIKCRGFGRRRQVTLECFECGKPFQRGECESNRRGRRAWCSWACWRKTRQRGAVSYPKIGQRHAHRVVMERKLKRSLLSSELVHHRDEDRKNFDISNLQITDRVEHAQIHFRKQRCPLSLAHRRKLSDAKRAFYQRQKAR